jgi:N-acetylglutamate synthase-like GNAT family acetyltransferase
MSLDPLPTIRPATRADIDQFISEPLPWRVRAFAVDDDEGKLLGVGGFSYQPNDVIAAFVLKVPGAEKYKVALHRAGLMAMREAREAGYRRVVALAAKTNPAAERWLARLGFKPVIVDNEQAWVWEASN